MLEILGTIAANILSLPGILGVLFGMMTRNPLVGSALGALVGVAKTFVFAGMSFANAEPLEMGIAIIVGAVFGGLGSMIRRIGATV